MDFLNQEILNPTNALWTVSIMIAGYIAKSLSSLNVKMAVIVEKVSSHEKQIRDNTTDIKELIRSTKREIDG